MGDLNGNETTVVYPSGSSTEASYLEDGAGRRLSFGWSGGRLVSVTDGLDAGSGGPRAIGFSYSGGDLVGFSDEAGGVWSMVYDGAHRLVSVRSPRFVSVPAKSVEVAYVEATGKVAWQEDELGERISFAYGGGLADGSTTVSDAEGNDTVYRYVNAALAAVSEGVGTPSESVTRFQRDGYTRAVLATVDGRQNRWRFEVDGHGRRVAAEDPLGRISRWEYNSLDQVTVVSSGEVRTGGSSTSTAAQVIDRVGYDSAGNVLSVTRADGTAVEATTVFVHGDAAHLEDVTSVVDARGKTWSATYDDATGEVSAVTDPLGATTTWGYNDLGWVTSTVTAKGNAAGATPGDYRTVFERNLRGQVTKATNPLGDVVRAVYDVDANLTGIESHLSGIDSVAQVTTYVYDDAGRVVGVDEPGPGSRGFEYDGNGDLTAQVDEAGTRSTYTYDPLRRVSTQTSPAGGVTRYAWDKASNLTAVAQPGPGSTCVGTRMNCISITYDSAGQRTGIDYSDPSTADVTAITHDLLGRQVAASTGGVTETWAWDAQGRLTGGVDANNRSTGYGWDAAGNLTQVTYPGAGKVVNRVFDDAGHLVSVTDWAGRTTGFAYDANSNWTQTTFPSASTNVDVRAFDHADQLTGVTWKRGATALGSLTYGPRDPNGLVTSVTAAGAGIESNAWGYDDRNQLTSTATEGFAYDAVSNLVDADGVRQVFDAAQQLCWTSPTATSGTCATPTEDATVYGFDARGNRTSKTLPSGTATSFGFDGANRLASVDVPTVFDPESRQFQLLSGGAVRVADGADGTGSCNSAPCAPFTASTVYDVDVAGQGGVPASGVTAVTGTVTVSAPDGDGWLSVNAAGDAAAAAIPLQDGQSATASFTARLDASGEIQLDTDVDATVAVDVTGYWTPPPAWIPALNYWPTTPAIAAQSATGTGTCDGAPCTTLAAGTTEVDVTGIGGVPASGVAAVTVGVVALGTTAGRLRVAPNGDASAGDISWEASFPNAAGSFTVPVKSNGTIDVEVANATNIVLSVTGYWKMPTNTDTGLGLNVLDAPERLVDTRDGTGTCNDDPCDQIAAFSDVTIDVTGHAGVPDNASAVMLAVNIVDPVTPGIASVGANPTEGGAPLVFAAGENAQASFITGLSDDGTLNVNSWAATDLTIDIVGYFTLPTLNYTYDYDATGLRSAKTFEQGPAEGGWRNEYTWNRSSGLPMLLAEHSATGTSYLIYGPKNTPIYQITKTGDVMYYHQDHLGSTRLTTNANGTTRGTLTYTAYGETKTNTNPWFLEQPLLTYAGEQQDPETGLIYLRARHYDPTTGQFMSLDPIVIQTWDAFGYASQNPANATDPTGLICIGRACVHIPIIDDAADVAEDVEEATDRAWNAEWATDWGTRAAGIINVPWGVSKVGAGSATIVFTPVCGPPCFAIGGWNIVTGLARFDRGVGQLNGPSEPPDDLCRTGDNLARLIRGLLPFGATDLWDFLGGLP